jgi:hypothetical protein
VRLTLLAILTVLPVFIGGCRAGPELAGGEVESSDARTQALHQQAEPTSVPSTGAGQPDAEAPARQAGAPSTRLHPFPGVVVLPEVPAVELQGWVCLEYGWLEQIACAPGTREHESLVVPRAKPSQIHAALLMAGFEPGAPGRWSYEDEEYSFTPPTGTALDVFVRYTDESDRLIEEPIRRWIRDHLGRHEFPREPWIFAGSAFAPNPEWMGKEGEHYVADVTGSIIGLVTFGDEVVGFSRVLADQVAVQPPEWEVNTGHIPPVGTPVTLILRPFEP